MNCKFCGEEMPDDGKFCPYCGLDNQSDAPESAQPCPEDEPQEKAVNLKGWRLATAISGCVAVMAVLALLLFAVTGIFHLYGRWDVTKEATCFADGSRTRTCLFCDETQTETISAQEHNYENKVCTRCGHGNYIASDDTAVANAEQIVATAGDLTLTNAQFQVYYQMQITSFLNSYYYYLTYIGFDYTKSLDTQQCYFDSEKTWHEYFVEKAINYWYQTAILAAEAEKNAYVLDDDAKKTVEDALADLESSATKQGYESTDKFLQSALGATADMAGYRLYIESYYLGSGYFEKLYKDIPDIDGEELDSYFAEHKEELEKSGITQDDEIAVDVRHILISLGKDADGNLIQGKETDGVVSFDDADAEAAAKAEAERILALWQENPTEEYFSELANEHSHDQDGKVTDGGIYRGIQKTDNYVTQFLNWCFEDGRQVGDAEIVKTIYGYHIMYFSASEAAWKGETRDYYRDAKVQEMVEELVKGYELKVDYEKIALAYVSLT